jgi:hypothetical protein
MSGLKAIYALYPDPDAAQRAVDALRRAVPEPGRIAVLSSEPFDEEEFGRSESRTVMPWLAALGGLLGGLGGYALTGYTQHAYPISTGGMPIAPLWTNGIIIYELTMLGAILATFFTLLLRAHIPNWRRELYDPAISDGRILVGVLDPPEDRRSDLVKAFLAVGAAQVKEFDSE